MVQSLSDLPNEILFAVIACLDRAADLAHLGCASRQLASVVKGEGWRIFTQNHLGAFALPEILPCLGSDQTRTRFWKDAALGLRLLSRNWDNKTIIARSISKQIETSSTGPSPQSNTRNRNDSYRRMNLHKYMCLVTSHESFTGSTWASRRQTVAWAAGHHLVIGRRNLPIAGNDSMDQYSWTKIQDPEAQHGIDDISYVQLLSLPQTTASGDNGTYDYADPSLLMGRASGDLRMISFPSSSGIAEEYRQTIFRNERGGVRAAHAHPQGVLAACLADDEVAIYPWRKTDERNGAVVQPIALQRVTKASDFGRTWSCRFLKPELLAIGSGINQNPLSLYNLEHGSITEIVFNRQNDRQPKVKTSIYAISPFHSQIAGSSQESPEMTNPVFLTGAYDGLVRLHDLRCAVSVVSTYEDEVDMSSIYSLLPICSYRFVAGGARQSLLKIFDLRSPGDRSIYNRYQITSKDMHRAAWLGPQGVPTSQEENHTYSAFSEFPTSSLLPSHSPDGGASDSSWTGTNIFLGDELDPPVSSPVYSLSSPSSISPTIFAGIEGHAVQLDLVAFQESHWDPVYGTPTKYPMTRCNPNSTARLGQDYRRKNKETMERTMRKCSSFAQILALAGYQQTSGQVILRKQIYLNEFLQHAPESVSDGWDKRWRKGKRIRRRS